MVGVAGYARSGKDTFAHALVEGAGFTRRALADAIKEDVARFLGIAVEEVERRKDDLRHLLKWYGTEWRRRECGGDYWIDRLERWLRKDSQCNVYSIARIVVPDVRFPNEAEWVRNQGGIVVRVVKRGQVSPSDHESERPLPDELVDVTVEVAPGDVEGLQARARMLARVEGWVTP